MSKYILIANCPVRGSFPEKSNERIDWEAVGLDKVDILRNQAYGFDVYKPGDSITVYPITDEAKLIAHSLMGSVNDNDNPDDSITIISEAEADLVKSDIAEARALQ